MSRDVADRLDGAGSPAVGMAVRRLAAAAADLGAATQAMQHDADVRPRRTGRDEPEPDGEPAEPEEHPALPPTTRTAIQVVVAGALSIYVGGLVAPGQWFWAVITAFVVFAGATAAASCWSGPGRGPVGTLAGVVAGVVVASLVTGHVAVQGAVVLLCVFLAFYLLPLSYGLMTFFVTTMLGVLYGLLGRFSVAFLEIRLLETVIGAVAGAVAALIVLPTRTRGGVAERPRPSSPRWRSCSATRPTTSALARTSGRSPPRRATWTTQCTPCWSARGRSGATGSATPGPATSGGDTATAGATATRGFARMIGPAAVPPTRTPAPARGAGGHRGRPGRAVAVREPDRHRAGERACEQEGTLVDLVEAVEGDPLRRRSTSWRLRGCWTTCRGSSAAVHRGAGPRGAAGPTLRAVSTTAVPRAHLTVVRGARLFDGAKVAAFAAPTVVIDGNRIVAVDAVPVAEHAVLVDMPGATLMPGLVDTHVHLAFDASADVVGGLAARTDPAARSAMAAAARSAARSGVTTVRDLGDRGYLSLALRARAARIHRCRRSSPRVLPSPHRAATATTWAARRPASAACAQPYAPTSSAARTSSRSWPAAATLPRAADPNYRSSNLTSCGPPSTRPTGMACRSRPMPTAPRPSPTRSRPASTASSTSRS